MKFYLSALKNYAKFSGCATRKEYWMFVLFNMIFVYVAVALDSFLGLSDNALMMGPIYGIYILATFIPSLAIAVRRLHDVGKSGWMLFVSLVPIIGIIWLLVLLCTKTKNNNL